jgi:hypothetical protein
VLKKRYRVTRWSPGLNLFHHPLKGKTMDEENKSRPDLTVHSTGPAKNKEKSTDTTQQIKKKSLMNGIVSAINRDPIATLLFRQQSFPNKYHIEQDDEGHRSIMLESGNGIMRYVSDDKLRSDIVSWTFGLGEESFGSYWCDSKKAAEVVSYWKDRTPVFPHKIHPVLQKDTPGYTFHRLDFNAQDVPTPTFDYLVDTLDTNKEAFVGFIGALFDASTTLQQYLWITGSGGDGKGALFRLLARIFQQSYTSVSTDTRHVDKYWASCLMGKRVAVAADTTNPGFINTSTFKSVTGGDTTTIRKMRREEFSVRLNAMFLFGANMDPALTTEQSGLRRAIICRMDKDRYQHIDGFEDRLWAERAGIVFRCRSRWMEFKKNGLTIPVDEESHRDLGAATEEMHQQLVDQYFELGPDLTVSASEVITILKEGEKRPPNNHELGEWKRYLDRVHGVRMGFLRQNGSRVRCYRGMGVRSAEPSKDDRF